MNKRILSPVAQRRRRIINALETVMVGGAGICIYLITGLALRLFGVA